MFGCCRDRRIGFFIQCVIRRGHIQCVLSFVGESRRRFYFNILRGYFGGDIGFSCLTLNGGPFKIISRYLISGFKKDSVLSLDKSFVNMMKKFLESVWTFLIKLYLLDSWRSQFHSFLLLCCAFHLLHAQEHAAINECDHFM